MESSRLVSVVLLLAVAAAAGAVKQLPEGIKACLRSDPDLNACAMRNANAAIPLAYKGYPSYGLPPMDPLRVSEVRVEDSGSSRQVALDLTMNDVDIIGMKDAKLDSFKVDLAGGELSWSGVLPVFAMLGRYNVSGRVLVLPIRGSGPMNLTLEEVRFWHTFKMAAPRTQDGREFLEVTNSSLKFETTRFHVLLENLFDGQKELSDQMNLFLNENWQELIKDLGPPIAEVLNLAIASFVKTILKQVPLDLVFPLA